ncbi:hypothetical protein SUDANB1_05619 [Streptomyces sp. enrichment culture]|uniref:hypothetical protein n=1 Tax=Streptomyces sp. enrichment culture TaxID=1795815 RepID=UPI003F56D35B
MGFLDRLLGSSSSPHPGASPYASTRDRDRYKRQQAKAAKQAAGRRARHRAEVFRGGVDPEPPYMVRPK